jgi:prepilin-type N-terminal cleavage/methylation domain-containing protein
MKRTQAQKGFSFMEVVVVIAIFTVILGALVSSITFFYKSNRHAIEQTFAIGSARRGIELMVRDLREATYSDEGSYPVISITDNSVTFYSDVDTDSNIEKVRYFLDSGDLKKGVIHASGDPLAYTGTEAISIISDNVQNEIENTPIFLYYDTNGDAVTNTASTTDVAFVKVNLIINTNPTQSPNDFTLRSSATLRNVRVNQ